MKKRLLITTAACMIILSFAGCHNASKLQQPQNEEQNVSTDADVPPSSEDADVPIASEDTDAPTVQAH